MIQRKRNPADFVLWMKRYGKYKKPYDALELTMGRRFNRMAYRVLYNELWALRRVHRHTHWRIMTSYQYTTPMK
jgi:hypothetical protein